MTGIVGGVGGSECTVSRLRASIPEEYLKQAETLKKGKIAGLVVEFLDEAIESLIRIDRITLDQDWLVSQDAASLATFYGVKADKVIRILEASERANGLHEAGTQRLHIRSARPRALPAKRD